MKNRNLFVLLAIVLMVAFWTLPAFADAGAPGATFPEQPGSNVATACAVVGENIALGRGSDDASAVALAIVFGVYGDACLGQ